MKASFCNKHPNARVAYVGNECPVCVTLRCGDPSDRDQIGKFSDDLDKFVTRARYEYSLTYATLAGCLFAKAHILQHEAIEVSKLPPQ